MTEVARLVHLWRVIQEMHDVAPVHYELHPEVAVGFILWLNDGKVESAYNLVLILYANSETEKQLNHVRRMRSIIEGLRVDVHQGDGV